MTSSPSQIAGELSILGLGLPTDILGFTFEDRGEKLRWDSAIVTRAMEVLKAQAEGKSAPDSDRKDKMTQMLKDKRKRRLNPSG